MRWIAVVAVLAISGCARDREAVISDIDDAKVVVQEMGLTNIASIPAVAERGCRLYNRTARAISKQCLNQYCTLANHLFACVPKQPTTGADEDRVPAFDPKLYSE